MSHRSAGESPRVMWELQGVQIVQALLYTKVFFFLYPDLVSGEREQVSALKRWASGYLEAGQWPFSVNGRWKWNVLTVASYLSLNFLAIHSECQITVPGLGRCGVSALCAHRGCVIAEVCAPNYLPFQWRTDCSNAMCKNHTAAAPQTRYRCPWSQWQHCPVEKILTTALPKGEGIWARVVNNYQPGCRCSR